MNSKTIGGIIVGITIIVIVIVFASNSDQDIPDTPIIQQPNTTTISDSATVIKNPTNNTNYIIDENGNKQYVITASDSPTLGD
ncbi:MAG: hypothetical protein EPO37_00740 [Nitrosarchaeum sp.]|nr:MAG: hypothetical protein EPO37_00740 [Nitrosarchaeum sp.]